MTKLSSSDEKIANRRQNELIFKNDPGIFTRASQLNEEQCLGIIQNPDFAENLSVFI